MRFYTADFHLGMEGILEYENRPFSSIAQMDRALIDECNMQAQHGDIIYHVGDLASWKQDRGGRGLSVKPMDIVDNQVDAMFVNIKGNHDINNKVVSVCESMRTKLGKRYPYVSVSHYPSYDIRSAQHFQKGDIHICGHVHRRWRHCLDLTNNVLNINVGVDAWNFKLVSEDLLVEYLNKLFKKQPNELHRCKILDNGRVQFMQAGNCTIQANLSSSI